MELTITLELEDAHILASTFSNCSQGFGRRVCLAIRNAKATPEPCDEKPSCPPLKESKNFLLYLAALNWWYDFDAERIARRLRKEWLERRTIPGIARQIFSDQFPADFTVEGVKRLQDLATAEFSKRKDGEEGER